MKPENHPFSALSPDFILDAIESRGFRVDARILELNSYENRVFQIGIENREPIIAKFYRPDRWSQDQVQEEHDFLLELASNELSVVAPISLGNTTQFKAGKFMVALFERRGGRTPLIESESSLEILGRTLSQIHNVGAAKPFLYRPSIDVDDYGKSSRSWLLEAEFIPINLEKQYETISNELISRIEEKYSKYEAKNIRIHADCHLGNILWREQRPHFVDFDDSRNGPAVQDLWMFLSGSVSERSRQMTHIIRGYLDFREFNFGEVALIESLRALRMMRHSAWIGKRWDDPAFPKAFPFFNTEKYWVEHLHQLSEQVEIIEEEGISLNV